MKTIDVTAHSPATARELFALVADGATWPTWSPISSFALERPGDTEREGIGAVRVFRTDQTTGRVTSRERIVELVPDRRLSYELLSGLPLRGYHADIDLTPDGTGTTIRWRSTFRPKVPGTGWLYRMALARFIQRCATGLAAAQVARRPE